MHTRSSPQECPPRHPGGGKNLDMAQTFENQFFRVNGNYPVTDFMTPGWIHPPKAWCRDLSLYVLAHFEKDLERLGLREAVRATYYGIQMGAANFYAIFELYCPATGTFFTPVDELGMAFHEM